VGSRAASLELREPRAKSVAPNSAIVLEGYVFGELIFAARHGKTTIAVTVETARELSSGERFASTFYLVRPAAGVWPHGTVVLEVSGGFDEKFKVRTSKDLDLAAPELVSMGAPEARRSDNPFTGIHQYIAIPHGGFMDAASPLIHAELELPGGTHRGLVGEGGPGQISLSDDVDVSQVIAITLTDLAGNARRIDAPCGSALPSLDAAVRAAFTCVAGRLEAAHVGFVGIADGTSDAELGRGHYLSTQPASGDLEISVKVWRLTNDHEMPIEIAFRGGFFAVTGMASWSFYERADHWTGWQPTGEPAIRNGMIELRVTQRGSHVTGYANGKLLGSFELDAPPPEGPVGLQFKGHPGTLARISFTDFVVR
jgi:hypothetical protein